MLPQRKPYLTPAEYLAMERQSETKNDYWDGEVYALAGTSRNHNLIVTNITISLGTQVKGRPCEVYPGDMRVKAAAHAAYTYPDVVVVCGQPEFEDHERDTLLNPTVLIEVLSPSTEAYDRGAKFEAYRSLPSLADYLLVAQDRAAVEHYTRQVDDRWLLTAYAGLNAVVQIESIGCELRLADLYDKVEFPPTVESVGLRRVKEAEEEYWTGSFQEDNHLPMQDSGIIMTVTATDSGGPTDGSD